MTKSESAESKIYCNFNDVRVRCKYYNDNYDAIFTYVHTAGKTQLIKDPGERICRFCGKRYPDVRFRKKAHAIPELIGNKEFVLSNECDTCNDFFGRKLEDNFGKYLGLGRTLSQIFGKEGVPSFKTKNEQFRIDFSNVGLVIKQCEQDGGTIEMLDHTLHFHTIRDTYIPIAVYKTFVKMALSLIPFDKLIYFKDTIKWLLEDSNLSSKYDMSNYAHAIERYIPGPNPLPLRACGFIRKDDSLPIPYYQFLLEFYNYSFQIIVPCDIKDKCLYNLDYIDFVCIPGSDELTTTVWPFGKPTSKLIDLSNKNKIKGETLDLYLNFDYCEMHEGHGESITDFFNKNGINLPK